MDKKRLSIKPGPIHTFSLYMVQEESLVLVSLQSTVVDPPSMTAPASSRKRTHSSSLANPSSVLMKDTRSVGRYLEEPKRGKEGIIPNTSDTG